MSLKRKCEIEDVYSKKLEKHVANPLLGELREQFLLEFYIFYVSCEVTLYFIVYQILLYYNDTNDYFGLSLGCSNDIRDDPEYLFISFNTKE